MANPYVVQTWTDGVHQTTAARMNVIETGIFDAHKQPAVRAYHNAPQAITTATNTALALNSERYDQDGLGTSTIHDTVTNNSRLTCRVAGIYQMVGNIQFAANATGIRYLWVQFNGATNIGSITHPGNATDQLMTITTAYQLAVNDYVELYVHQTSGGNLNVNSTANNSPEFMMHRVG